MYKYKITHTRVHHEDGQESRQPRGQKDKAISEFMMAWTQCSAACNVKTMDVKKNMMSRSQA